MGREKGPTLRLFVACPLPSSAVEALAKVQVQLQTTREDSTLQRAPPLRWVRPQGIHLTLKFLGEVAQERKAAIVEALTGAVAGFPSLVIDLAGLGTFGDRRGPRVVWVGITGEVERLAELQRRVEAALVALGFPAEERPFSPHLTLARVGQDLTTTQRQSLAQLVLAVESPAIPVPVFKVSLMRSILGRGGAIYEEVAVFLLQD